MALYKFQLLKNIKGIYHPLKVKLQQWPSKGSNRDGRLLRHGMSAVLDDRSGIPETPSSCWDREGIGKRPQLTAEKYSEVRLSIDPRFWPVWFLFHFSGPVRMRAERNSEDGTRRGKPFWPVVSKGSDLPEWLWFSFWFPSNTPPHPNKNKLPRNKSEPSSAFEPCLSVSSNRRLAARNWLDTLASYRLILAHVVGRVASAAPRKRTETSSKAVCFFVDGILVWEKRRPEVVSMVYFGVPLFDSTIWASYGKAKVNPSVLRRPLFFKTRPTLVSTVNSRGLSKRKPIISRSPS